MKVRLKAPERIPVVVGHLGVGGCVDLRRACATRCCGRGGEPADLGRPANSCCCNAVVLLKD